MFKRILAQIVKELTQIRRDRLALVLALVLPQILLMLIGKAISLQVSNLPIAILDLDRTPTSRKYVDTFRSSLTFDVYTMPTDRAPETLLDRGEAKAVIVIPENFEHDFVRGFPTETQCLIDATDANTANLVRGNAIALSQNFLAGTRPPGAQGPVIQARPRFWYNPGRSSDIYVGPGVFAVVLALFPPLLSALAMSRESEQKTILQVYVSSISAHEYLLGKIFAYCLVAVCQWFLALGLSMLYYGIRLKGDPTPLLVGTVVYLFANVCFGVMIGTRIPNQAAAIQAVQLGGFLLSFLMSGFIFPVSNIPYAIRWIAAIVPARYYIELSRDAFVRGVGWSAVWHAPLILAVIGAVLFLSAWKKMRKMQVDA